MVRNTSTASAKASAKIEAFPTVKVRTFADHVPGPAPVTIVRKSAAALTATEQQTFMNAITSAIADGAYSTLCASTPSCRTICTPCPGGQPALSGSCPGTGSTSSTSSKTCGASSQL